MLSIYRGLTAELAVDVLFARYPLRHASEGINTETWFPFFSLISEDITNESKGQVKHSFDLKILQDTDGRIVTGKRVQVKSGRNDQDKYDETIRMVRVKDDLAIKRGECDVDFHIIMGCQEERNGTGTSYVSKVLDERTSKALGRLGIAV